MMQSQDMSGNIYFVLFYSSIHFGKPETMFINIDILLLATKQYDNDTYFPSNINSSEYFL